MTRIILLFGCLLTVTILTKAQTKTADVKFERVGNHVILTAENVGSKNYSYTFNFALQNLKKVEGSEKVEIPIKEKVSFIKFEIVDPQRPWRYDYNYNYTRYYPNGAMADIAQKLNIDESIAANSIIVFDKDGCSRCDRTLDYLKRKKIPHYVLDISEDPENKELMFGYVNDVGLVLGTITTPMVIVESKANFNIQNLDAFIYSLKKYRVKR
ncbi:hypothetical protein BFP97_12375 [Roseivirga sp. 4D4]|uniref:glutaredoxin family protein n=1 Tax=Roseivirga sp. 4D4 TaxID=1889784 RepID=UPI0008530B2F|nr:glutaredoxin domain-containing protein [Roseivirga sp. 4D4]OEK02264.1 hypothetical protein BFP97_12375 [Roseivirga sp. 4D4]